MAYQSGYGGGGGGGGPQRSYGGSTMQHPGPHGYGEPPAQRQYGAQEQSYNDRQDGYGYGDQYQSNGFGRNPPAQDYYGHDQGPNPGRGGGPMPPFARGGGPIARPGTADGHRGGYGAPRGRGMPPGPGRGMPGGGRPGQYPQGDFGARRPPPNQRDPGYGGYDQDNQLSGQMAGMNLNGQRHGGRADGRSSYEHDAYGRPVEGGSGAPQGYGDPRRGPPAGQAPGGYGGYDDGYGGQQSGQRNEFGPPGRSMTMPNYDMSASQDMAPPRRLDTMPYGDAAGRNQPQGPAGANSQRPPPQRIYPSDRPVPQRGQYGGGYGDNSQGYGNNGAPAPVQPSAVDDVYDSYYSSPRGSGSDYHNNNQQNQTQAAQPGYGGFDNSNDGYGQPRQPGLEQPQPGALQTPRLHNAKSEATFHEPQTAVFEMAGDIPSMPPMPAGSAAGGAQAKAYQPDFNHGYGAPPAGYDQLPPRGPSAPPGPVHDMRQGGGPSPNNNGAMSRHNPSASNPDALPSHPAPVRPGLMANSMVNLNDRPPPVRNYGNVPQAGYPQQQAQQYSQRQPPPQQQQAPPVQQPVQQQAPLGQGRAGYQAPAAPQVEEPVTAPELEQLRQLIKSNPNDQQSAFRLAKRLIEAADVLAPKLPELKQRARARERYLLDAHKILKKLSQSQNMEAMFTFADSIGKGLFGHEPDNKEAFTLYQSAAKLGHAAAAYRTAVCCEIGHEEGGGTRKDPLKAMQWYKRAATLGDPPAMYKVGMILLKGLLGQQKNPREAVSWLRRAGERADSENPHALHELGLLYESAQPNDAIVRDERYALDLFQQAADLGYKFSQYRLGHAFENGGLGCPNDPRLSIFWYSKAATQEEHQSELALSGWYLTGSPNVLSQSDTEAYLWARKAAVAGLAKAEYAMGYFTEVGIGVPPNLEDAKRWYWRAAAQDFPKARERLEQLKRVGKSHPPRPRERISRSRIEKQQDGDCTIM